MSQLSAFCDSKGVKISVKFGAPENETFKGSTGYTVTLRYKGRQLTCPFYMGSALTGEPSAADVLSCLISDSSACDQSFEEWASDLGYDIDSRKAEATYNACVKSGEKVRRLLGSDFGLFASKEH